MNRLFLVIAFILVSFVTAFASVSDAQACSCGRASPAMLVNNADRVFVARVGTIEKSKQGYETTLKILHTLKGTQEKEFVWHHASTTPLCGPTYASGEVHVVFVRGQDIGLCSGNYGMAAQFVALPSYIKAAKLKTTKVKLAYMQQALSAVLKGYTHDRKTISVRYAPLAGKTILLDGSALRFRVGTKRGSIIIDNATQLKSKTGRWAIVRGRYPTEGIHFEIFIGGPTQTEILYQRVYER